MTEDDGLYFDSAATKKAVKKAREKSDFTWVRSIYGRGENAKEQYHHIKDGGVNDVIKSWHDKQPERDWKVASPSRILTCPRVVWLHNQGVEPTNPMTWAVKQRLLLGRLAENIFAKQFADEGILLHHWKDDPDHPNNPFAMGEGIDRLEGTPDFLLNLKETWSHRDVTDPENPKKLENTEHTRIAVSDAKTSRSDSFGFIPISAPEIWSEWNWYRNKIQLTAYYMLLEANQVKNRITGNKDGYVLLGDGGQAQMPEVCHLFSYALDDGVVRREETWEPTKEDMETVKKMTRRFNEAVASKTMPPCTCKESFDEFDVKFCDFGVPIEGKKISEECCSDSLAPKQEKLDGTE